MVISYHGGQCFKVSFGNTTIAFDPIAKASTFKEVKFGADVVFVSLRHPNFNGVEQMSYGDREAFIVKGAGEYEIGEVTARAFGVPTMYENEKRINTIYQVTLEGINMVFLGALGDSTLEPKILEAFGDIDILFLPIGGGDVLDVPQAAQLAVKLEPHCIIPMHYDQNALTAFTKEYGADGVKPVDKLTVKKKDILGLQGELYILSV